MKYIIYKVVKTLGKPIYKLIYRPRVIGIENIPKSGGVILASNHINNLDAATMIGIPNRIVHTLAKKELFESKFGNKFYTSMACIRVDRDSHNDNVKETVEKVLENGGVVGIFPEGTTNKKREEIVLPFKYGAVSFAKKTGCPIVPFAISGEYKKFKKGLTVEFGKPIYIKDDLEVENQRLMNIIIDMIRKENTNENIK